MARLVPCHCAIIRVQDCALAVRFDAGGAHGHALEGAPARDGVHALQRLAILHVACQQSLGLSLAEGLEKNLAHKKTQA